jgi:hypothetical protein
MGCLTSGLWMTVTLAGEKRRLIGLQKEGGGEQGWAAARVPQRWAAQALSADRPVRALIWPHPHASDSQMQ